VTKKADTGKSRPTVTLAEAASILSVDARTIALLYVNEAIEIAFDQPSARQILVYQDSLPPPEKIPQLAKPKPLPAPPPPPPKPRSKLLGKKHGPKPERQIISLGAAIQMSGLTEQFILEQIRAGKIKSPPGKNPKVVMIYADTLPQPKEMKNGRKNQRGHKPAKNPV
jgi:hypothetical protein